MNRLITDPNYIKLTDSQKATLLEKLTYFWNGKPLTAVINYNYMVFYDSHGMFVMTMGFFIPSFWQDLKDRDITVRISPVQLELLL